jgi:hypothetical protein
VDNGGTMEEHWGEVKYLLETLVMKVDRLDENGIDLMFTNETSKLENEKSISSIMRLMNSSKVEPKLGTFTDMKKSLGDILSAYLLRVDRGITYHNPPKDLTLIVLTDGKWVGDSDKRKVTDKIVTFAMDLQNKIGSLKDRPVSVEFIQFGNDEDATYRFRQLDDGLKYEGIP